MGVSVYHRKRAFLAHEPINIRLFLPSNGEHVGRVICNQLIFDPHFGLSHAQYFLFKQQNSISGSSVKITQRVGGLKSSKVPVSKSDRVAPQGSEINIWKRRKEYRSWMSENLFRFYCPLEIIAPLVFVYGQCPVYVWAFYHKIVRYTMPNKKLLNGIQKIFCVLNQ